VTEDDKMVISTEIFETSAENDAFFIKALATNMKCTGSCQIYGLSAMGSSFKLTVIDTRGMKKAIQSTSNISFHFLT
jgi:hypothetical protein